MEQPDAQPPVSVQKHKTAAPLSMMSTGKTEARQLSTSSSQEQQFPVVQHETTVSPSPADTRGQSPSL